MDDDLYYWAVQKEIKETGYDPQMHEDDKIHIDADTFLCLFPSPTDEDKAILRAEHSSETIYIVIDPNDIEDNLRAVLVANGRYLFRDKVLPLINVRNKHNAHNEENKIIHIFKR